MLTLAGVPPPPPPQPANKTAMMDRKANVNSVMGFLMAAPFMISL